MSTHFFGIKDWTFSYSHSVGRNEFAGTGFRNPVDLALGANDMIYVVNRSYENRPDGVHVTVMTFNEEYIREFGTGGEGDGQFVWPTAIALDQDENVYVADEWLNRISIFDKEGNFLGKWGKAGSEDGELNKPAGLAIANGTLYVSDWRNDRIQKFSPDGLFLASFGQSGSGIGQFNRPSGVCVDQDGEIYIADRENNRIQVLAPNGRFIAAFTGDHQLSKLGKEKLLSNPDMIRQRALAVAWDRGAFEKSLSHPCAVKVDEQYRIAVLDHTRGRIQVYTKSKDPMLVQEAPVAGVLSMNGLRVF